MSFADVRGGGGGGGAGGLGGVAGGAGARRADPELVALQRDVFRATTAVSQFKRSVDQVGTPKDTRKLREKIEKQRREISSNAQGTKERLKSLAGSVPAESLSRADKVARTKLVADFQSVLKEFERSAARYATAISSYEPQEEKAVGGAGVAGGGGSSDPFGTSAARESDPLLEAAREAERQRVEQQLEFNTAMLDEREEGIQDIAQQIGEVNEIFTDLATLVNEQGTMIEDIESNIVDTRAHTEGAEEQLIKAAKSQKSFRNKTMCFCILLLAGFVTLLILSLK